MRKVVLWFMIENNFSNILAWGQKREPKQMSKVFGGNSKMLVGPSFFDNAATYQVCLREMLVLAPVA
jgi:hypothetical protein